MVVEPLYALLEYRHGDLQDEQADNYGGYGVEYGISQTRAQDASERAYG